MNRGSTYVIKDGGNPRDVALYALLNINRKGKKSNVFLRETLDKENALSGKDKALCEHITESTLAHLYSIDGIIRQYSKTPLEKLNPYIHEILRLSVCQLLYMDRIPASAAINEGTELAKRHGLTGLSGYVNGVLRSISRDREEILKGESETLEKENRLTRVMKEGYIRYSVPEWLYAKLTEDFGLDAASSMFEAWLSLRKVSVRCNLSRGKTEEEIISSIRKEEITAEKICSEPPVYELSGLSGMGVGALTAFKNGWITVQDLSASMLTTYFPPEKGDRILDLCAAPGGKSLSYADALGDTGEILARDVSEEKVNLIRDNASRCGFTNIRAEVKDAAVLDKSLLSSMDLVIADLPCSGLGVVAKKPDIKKNVTPETIVSLQKLQREILKNAVQYVKPGGKLIYSTCTVTKEENEQNADYIAEELGMKPLLYKRFSPSAHQDGFFIAGFEKKE